MSLEFSPVAVSPNDVQSASDTNDESLLNLKKGVTKIVLVDAQCPSIIFTI
jgi:hypothetical protein